LQRNFGIKIVIFYYKTLLKIPFSALSLQKIAPDFSEAMISFMILFCRRDKQKRWGSRCSRRNSLAAEQHGTLHRSWSSLRRRSPTCRLFRLEPSSR
jgi:hypothetical protein